MNLATTRRSSMYGVDLLRFSGVDSITKYSEVRESFLHSIRRTQRILIVIKTSSRRWFISYSHCDCICPSSRPDQDNDEWWDSKFVQKWDWEGKGSGIQNLFENGQKCEGQGVENEWSSLCVKTFILCVAILWHVYYVVCVSFFLCGFACVSVALRHPPTHITCLSCAWLIDNARSRTK